MNLRLLLCACFAPTQRLARPVFGCACLLVLPCLASNLHAAQIIVDGAADNVVVDGKTTLREALLSFAVGQDWNADVAATRSADYASSDNVKFAIASGAQAIFVASPLPAVKGVSIDGTTQPGYIGQRLIALDGSNAGSASDGLVLLDGSAVVALDVAHFGGNGLHVDDDILFAHGFDGSAIAEPPLAGATFIPIAIGDCSSTDNGGDGLRIDAGTAATLSGSSLERNRGSGLRVRGRLLASQMVVHANAGDGVLVDSADAVELDHADIQNNGQHPALPPTDQAGIRLLRASRADTIDPDTLQVVERGGFWIHQGAFTGIVPTVAHHGGDGIVVGDPVLQTGVVQALIADLQIHHNRVGIRVAQRDMDAHRSAVAILSNNVYDNVSEGLHLGTAYMYPVGPVDRRVVSSNDFHHNAVTPAGQCSVATATQTASQVVVDGPVAATQAEQDACHPAGVDTFAECIALNNPNGVQSNGVNNHCLWNGAACIVAWGLGGREGTASCDSSRNRIFAYVNDPNQDPFTQKGVAAINGAYVSARRNFWGVGGASNATFEAAPDSRIDANDDCGSISTCP